MVFLARSECRKGTWHVVTYDITNPDNWTEVDDIDTKQPCTEPSSVIGLNYLSRRQAHEIGWLKRTGKSKRTIKSQIKTRKR